MVEQVLTLEVALAACRQRFCPFCAKERVLPGLRGVWRHLDNWHYGQELWPQLDRALRKELGEPV